MNGVTQLMSFPQPSKRNAPYVLSLYLLLASFTLMGFVVISSGIIALAHYGLEPANPFTVFVDILPDQPRSAVEARGFSCHVQQPYLPSEGHELCNSDLAAGNFSRIQVYIRNGIIVWTQFFIRDNRPSLGDLMLWLEAPHLAHTDLMAAYSWRGKTVVAFTTYGKFSVFKQVRKVVFTNIEGRPISANQRVQAELM